MAALGAWYGQTNFFPIRDNSKILYSSMGFSYAANSKKTIFMVLRGLNGSLAAFWVILGLKRAFFHQLSTKFDVL